MTDVPAWESWAKDKGDFMHQIAQEKNVTGWMLNVLTELYVS